jgi:hypothetical protein
LQKWLKRIIAVKMLLFVLFMENIQPALKLSVALLATKSVGSRRRKRN